MSKRSREARAELKASRKALQDDPVYSGEAGNVPGDSSAGRAYFATQRRFNRAEQAVRDSRNGR